MTGLGACCDANDLTSTSLKHYKVSNADEVARNRNGIGAITASVVANGSLRVVSRRCGGHLAIACLYRDVFFTIDAIMMVVMVVATWSMDLDFESA